MQATYKKGENEEMDERRVAKTGMTTVVGYILIIVGGFNCLSILGAIWGVPLIITGSKLFNAVKSAKLYGESQSEEHSFNSMNSFLKAINISGFLVIISAVLFFGSFIFFIITGIMEAI